MLNALPMELVDIIIMAQLPTYGYIEELKGLFEVMILTDMPIRDIPIVVDISNFLRANYIPLYDDLF